jgi:hypothetical protein
MLAIYVSSLSKAYSRSGVYFASDPGPRLFVQLEESKYKRILQVLKLKKIYSSQTTKIVVMSPNHESVIFFKLLTSFPVVLDAGWPLSDATINSYKPINIYRRVISFMIDLVSFKMANIIILETYAQAKRVNSRFLVRFRKIRVVYTGVNESEFSREPSALIKPKELIGKNQNDLPIVLFRGKNNLEAGLNLVIESAELIKECAHLVIATNQTISGLSNEATQITRFLSSEEISWLYTHAEVVLGQVSDNHRLNFTIPHKFFEAAYFAKCYVSTPSLGILEIVDKNFFIPVLEHSKQGIAESVIRALEDSQLRLTSGKLLNQKYLADLNQTKLGEKMREIITFI